jgi:tetratricopeptide (TPR) repeat protein
MRSATSNCWADEACANGVEPGAPREGFGADEVRKSEHQVSAKLRIGWSPQSGLGLLLAIVFLAPLSSFGAEEGSKADCEQKARREYFRAKAAHTKDLKNVKESWQFARACFDVGEFATNSDERAEVAEQGIATCRELIKADPNLPPAHYYLGMNLGQLARTRGLSALKLVGEMETEFKKAGDLDEKMDHSGPNRNLGLLYRDAPHIASIGNRSKAKTFLQKAVEVAPDFPENRLNLMESYLHWNDRNGAKRELKALEEGWAAAQKTFSGPEWACSWADWKKRLEKVKNKLGEPSKAIESPRGKD